MIDSAQEQLLGHLLGALDDQEQEAVDSRLKSDPELRRDLSRLRRKLKPLEAARREFDPPPGLIWRTCRLVEAKDVRPVSVIKPSPIESPTWVGRVRWMDVAVAATVFIAAALLTIPALQNSRFHSRVVACQNNLKEVGQAMKQYAQGHGTFFPRIEPDGELASAGAYAPILKNSGLLADARLVVCPDSTLADQGEFRIPSLIDLRSASPKELDRFYERMGGSYGYHIGYVHNGVYHGTKDLNRSNFALMSDAPGTIIPGYQSDNHGGRGLNVLLEDGRVIFVTTSRLGPGAADFFFNDNGEVAPGIDLDDSVIGSSSTVPIVRVKSGKR